MPKIKIDHIVSFSSEDSVHVANNILNNDLIRKWKSQETGETSVSLILQLEKATKITGIDIGNENSAFVEVLVGRSSSQDKDYKPILVMSSFMTPMEAKDATNSNRVRIFSYNDLNAQVRDEKWDRVKVVCTQPFNKTIQYGLSFITLNCPQEEKKDENIPVSLGKFKLRSPSPDMLTVGSLFAKRNEFIGKETAVEEMKKVSSKEWLDKHGTPKCKPTNINQASSTKTTQHNVGTAKKNNLDLFYDSDDDKPHEKIDKVTAKKKEEDEIKKKQLAVSKETPKKNSKGQKEATPKVESKTSKQDKKVNKKKNDDDDAPSTSKRKIDRTPNIVKKKVKLVTKPFDQFMNGVIFTISGIVNPERADIREMALKMGAKYKPNWDNTCSHLICAFANTPKFKEVQGKGKIVKKTWIPDCYSQRKLLPWRRYALDRNDQGESESEDEICEQEVESLSSEEETPVKQNIIEVSGSDTEDEIEKIVLRNKEQTANGNNDPFNIDTDEEKLLRNSKTISEDIPKIFEAEMFYIDDVFSDSEKMKLERFIKAINGYVMDHPRGVLDYIITDSNSAESMRKKYPDVKLVSPLWIYELYDMQQLVPIEKYLFT